MYVFLHFLTWFIYTETIIQPPPILESLVPPFPQPANTEDAIIEVLKYSQKDMDEANARVQAEVCPAYGFVIWQTTAGLKSEDIFSSWKHFVWVFE